MEEPVTKWSSENPIARHEMVKDTLRAPFHGWWPEQYHEDKSGNAVEREPQCNVIAQELGMKPLPERVLLRREILKPHGWPNLGRPTPNVSLGTQAATGIATRQLYSSVFWCLCNRKLSAGFS